MTLLHKDSMKYRKICDIVRNTFVMMNNDIEKINGQLYFRGDHIVPNFEEIWPSKKGGKSGRQLRGLEYYLDAMENGPQLSGRFKFFFIKRCSQNLDYH